MPDTDAATTANGGLRRVIGFWGGTAFIVGVTIGSGIFRKPPTIAGLIPNPMVIMGLWVLFGIISLCGALTLAELSSLLPRAGGVYVYLRRAYGDAIAFVFGWLYVVVATPATVGALATVFAEFLLNLADVPTGGFRMQAIAIAAIVVLAAANILGAKVGADLGTLLTVIKVGALVAIVLGAFMLGQGSLSHITGGPVPAEGLARAVASVIWTYDGWIAVSMIAGEVVAPAQLMKRITIVGMSVIVALYVLANLAYFYMMPLDVMAGQQAAIARTVMSAVAGPIGGTIILLCIMCSVLGALNANMLAKPRVAYAMARDGLTFPWLGIAHRQWATPWVAIVVQAVLAIVMVLTLKEFDTLTTYFVVVEWTALIVSVAAVFVLRRTMADTPRPYKTPGYPWVPLVFIVGAAIGLAAIVWGEFKNGNYTPIYGLLIALAGFPIYPLWRKLVKAGGSTPAEAI